MTEKLKQTIQEEIIKLPKEAQEAINSLDWTKIAEEIGKKHLLDESETNNFQVETLLVLVSLTNPEFYATNIENNVGTTKEEAENMANEVFEKIFAPIGDIIEENIKKNFKDKNPNWEQSLNFILSGGDYSAFMEGRSQSSETAESTPVNPPTLQDVKDKLLIDYK